LTDDLEFGGLPGQVLRLVLLGEGDREGARLPGLGPDELLLEARDEAAGAQHQLHVLAAAALEHLAVEPAREINQQLVAVGGLGGLALAGLIGAALLGQDCSSVSTSSSDASCTGRVSSRVETSTGVKSGMTSTSMSKARSSWPATTRSGSEVIFRSGRDAARSLASVSACWTGLVERVLDDVGHERLAIDLAHVAEGTLPGRKPFRRRVGRHLGDLGVEFGVEVGHGTVTPITRLRPSPDFSTICSDMTGSVEGD
jgi:hypothetical protein